MDHVDLQIKSNNNLIVLLLELTFFSLLIYSAEIHPNDHVNKLALSMIVILI
jgi:hypothetical protein